jgi:cytoskeleton protein RodZ
VALGDIGTRLREERLRRGLELEQLEAETRIRAKYLRALEDERFDALPGDAYARAFLRDYAEELGLDAQQLVDELNEATGPPEDVVLAPPRTVEPLRGPWAGRGRALALAALVAVALVAILVAGLALAGAGSSSPQRLAGASGRQGGSTPPASSGPTSAGTSAPSASSGPATGSAPPGPAPRAAAFALAAAGGPCWLEVRVGSASGRLLYAGTLESGQARRFNAAPLWVRVGAPWNLTVRAAGRRLGLPIASAGNVMVTKRGVTTA